MDSLNFTVSKELRTILQKASEMARSNSDKEITLELVTYLIFNEYINEGAGESKVIGEVLKDYKSEDKEDIIDLCVTEYKRVSKKTTLPDHSEDVTLSEMMEDSFKRANISNELRRSIIGKEDVFGIIDSETLLMWGILFEENSKLVKDLAKKYELNKEKFIAQALADSLFDDASGKPVLKEKRIEAAIPPEEKKEEKKKAEDTPEQPESQSSEDDKFEKAAKSGSISIKKRDPNSKTPVLDQYGLDMTGKAKEGGYDPLVGREKEISQVIEILCCRKKNNAALLGDAGTGKTALVEGLAQKIAAGDVPMELKGKRIFSVSTTDLQAGTIYRGQLEERVQELCNEVRDNKDVIVYIDEFHQAVSEGSSNIAQMLKPSLARGEMNMIVSTTTSEYRIYIEKDAALKRRFEPVMIEEPSVEETKEILKGISDQYANFHHVRFTDEVINKCVDWSGQYITDRHFPDKAIGIMDMSASLTKLEKPLDYEKRDELQKAIDALNKQADKAIEDAEFERASKIRDARIKVEGELKDLIESQEKGKKNWPMVTEETVSKVISKISGVPIDKIRSSSMTKLREMKEQLSSKVIGQDQAVSELTIALQRNILGLRDPHKPIASFLLVGPTGVGKALVNGTPVLTSEGWKAIETLKVGDLVQTPYNGYSKVSGVYPQGLKNTIYRVHFKDGRYIDTDENHLWQVRTPKQEKYYHQSEGSNLRHSSVISTKEMFERGKISGFFTKNDGYRFGIPVCPSIECEEKSYVIPPYVLGVLLGDGCLTESKARTRTLIVSSSEEDIIKRCSEMIGCDYRMHSETNYNNTLIGDNVAFINSKLKEYGLLVKSGKKFIPEDYFNGSKSQRLDLLAGIIDTDGHISKSGKVSISTTSDKLCKDIKYLCRSLGYIVTSGRYSRESKGDCYTIRISTNDTIYYSDKHLNSVKDIVRNREYHNDRLAITNIEILEGISTETTCISVEDEDKLFVTKDFIVTHNTLVSKVLAEEFFGSEKALITIACSEYMQDWAESKLLGSAPGYVGFSDSEPRLYALKRKPFCVLLIDEIEKSSSNLYNIWLNMLEEGEITLSNGEKVSCRDCIIIFTGNVGTKSLELKSADIGFGSSTKEDKKKKDLATVMKEVKKEFRPEFLNRLNKIVVFNSLEKPELEKIFDLELAKLQERLPDYKIQVTKKLKSWITDKTEPKYGARSLQRLIIEYIEQELCKTLLETDVESKKKPIKAKFDLDKEEENVIVTL